MQIKHSGAVHIVVILKHAFSPYSTNICNTTVATYVSYQMAHSSSLLVRIHHIAL